ncbi:unnamed protein product [Toxocara canis]|uniref:Uncharacterized protein n=1 Tax=Toxocara canis TaxID=6265 RepID=A0A183VF91_TOXCA|nr:unnamed protein product [Toxocara canis]
MSNEVKDEEGDDTRVVQDSVGDLNFILDCDNDDDMTQPIVNPVAERPFQRTASNIKNETDPVARVRRVGR